TWSWTWVAVPWPASVSVPPCGMASTAFCTTFRRARKSVFACTATVPRLLQTLQPEQDALPQRERLPLCGPGEERGPKVVRRPLELRRAHQRQVILYEVLQARQIRPNLSERLGDLRRARRQGLLEFFL